MRPDFMQSIPEGNWTLLNPDKRSGQLSYRNDATGAEILVPSIWYNQPVSWRVDYFRFCAERGRECARRLRSMKDVYRLSDADRMDIDACRLDKAADEMEQTGLFVNVT
jgi:hypothetical protein